MLIGAGGAHALAMPPVCSALPCVSSLEVHVPDHLIGATYVHVVLVLILGDH